MSLTVEIVGGGETKSLAKVTPSGELVVAPLSYSGAVFQAMAVADQAYHFYPPLPGRQFVITGMRLKATTGVSPTSDAEIIVYEASSTSSTTVDKKVHQEGMVKGDTATLIPINVLVGEGTFLNAKTDDATVNITIFGYYIDTARKPGGVPDDLT